jgi:phosphoribosylformimino-5-aminoimidazole carboxamide ribotide isomerase
MIVYPAIDLRAGHAVRLDQGDYARETRYGTHPVALARGYAEAGASWLHLVDLEAARVGRFGHLELIARIATECGLRVQAGGGVRSLADVEALIGAGASRVVVGSTAIRQRELVADWIGRLGADAICVALDARQTAGGAWHLPVAGWTQDSGIELHDTLGWYASVGGLRHVLCTDIERDGMYAGPNLALYRELATRYRALELQASGGVRDVADVVALRQAGAAGAVVGKALLEAKVSLAELLAC